MTVKPVPQPTDIDPEIAEITKAEAELLAEAYDVSQVDMIAEIDYIFGF